MMRVRSASVWWSLLLGIACIGMGSGCAKPLVRGNVEAMPPVTKTFSAGPNAIYYGVRWALAERGYPVGFEDLHGGVITTAWVPVGANSHYLRPFKTPDYGTTGAYHQLEVRVMPTGGGGTTVSVVSRVNSIIRGLHSSGREEAGVLEEIQHYLHGSGVEVTNIGVEE
ncbi:MAG: hypothetical protein HYV02_01680 [Deltaproteobacteria bacterium]|nr:hypothetical protein [Deltaproteobacteria bacterium]